MKPSDLQKAKLEETCQWCDIAIPSVSNQPIKYRCKHPNTLSDKWVMDFCNPMDWVECPLNGKNLGKFEDL